MGIPPGRSRVSVDLGRILDPATRTQVTDLQIDREQLAARIQQLEPLERDIQVVRGEADAAKAQSTTLARTNAELQSQLARHVADLGARDTELTTLRADVAQGRQIAIERDRLKSVSDELAGQIKQRDAAIAGHLAEIAELRANPPAPAVGGTLVPIASLATTVAAQVSTAQAAIRAAGGFTLANVSVRLKGVTEGDGSKIRILGANDLRNAVLAGAQDEVNFDFAAPSGPASVPADKVAVPDVAGLTQLATQRALAAVGLRLDPATGKAPASARAAPGQAYKQSLEAGALVDRGVPVLVVFAQ